MVWDAPDTSIAPNSGNTTASRQTLFTGEATRRAAVELSAALAGGRTLADVEGVDFHAEYTGITDKLGSPRSTPSATSPMATPPIWWSWTPRGRWRG